MSQRETAFDATLPPPPPDAERGVGPGFVVDGRYRILEQLGEGGMGAVFLAEHLALHKQVALKTIHAELTGHAEIAARFAREAMASARIEHPGVVSALDFGELEAGGAFLVMQLVRGEGLRSRLHREAPLPWREACDLMEQMADAVAAAHAEGIVHRDLKPENVVLEPLKAGGVQVRVLDFGIAHLRSEPAAASTGDARAPLTRLGVVMGTPGYMSPEQAVGQPVDERTDLYALGVMLWEMLVGRRPFDGDTLTAIVSQQFAAEPPPLPSDAQPVPQGLHALVAQLLAAQPELRPSNALEVRDRLRALRHEPEAGLSALAGSQAVVRALDAVKERAIAVVPAGAQASLKRAFDTGRVRAWALVPEGMRVQLVRLAAALKTRFERLPLLQRRLALGVLALLPFVLWLALREPAADTAQAAPTAAQARDAGNKTAKRNPPAPREERAAPAQPASTREPAAKEASNAGSGAARATNDSKGQAGGSGKQGGGRRLGDKIKRTVNSIFN